MQNISSSWQYIKQQLGLAGLSLVRLLLLRAESQAQTYHLLIKK